MIWTLENEKYRVELPDLYMTRRLPIIKGTEEFLTFDSEAHGSYIHSVRHDMPNNRLVETGVVLRHDHGTPDNNVHTVSNQKYHIHPMLLPMDKNNKPVNKQLLKEIPDGTIVNIGFLTCKGQPVSYFKIPLDDEFCLQEEGIGDPISWVACDGCLISRLPIFYDSAEAAWNKFYT